MKLEASQPFYLYTVGKKLIVALSGLFFLVFLLGHLGGNFLLLKNDGGVAFMEYAEFMATTPIVWASEVFFFSIFIIHIVYALALNIASKRARPVAYKVNRGSANSTFYSRFMLWSGITMLIFLVLHLWTFFFRYKILGIGEGSLYDGVIAAFSDPLYTGFYVLCMVLLGFHLVHGIQSAFQSMGLTVNKRLATAFYRVGMLLAIAIPAGFAAIPLALFFR